MAQGGVLQRDAREIYDRIDAVGEAAANLLVNTEDNAMTGPIDKPCPQNIANAAHQYEIIAPFAARNSRSGRYSESFFQLPSSNGEYGSRAA